ncbi:MAG: ArsB/NhaD family transporter [candidate division NC10 bacterium]|nr:ArsB/NhaD family transporter [candidate division NC10 bacterium]
MNIPSMMAVSVFLLTYVFIGMERINRTIVAMSGAILLLILNILSLKEAVTTYIHWETIGLLFGMFTIIAVLSDAGFFTYMALVVAKKLEYNPYKIFFVFPLVTAFLAAFMDSITVMLFFATLTYEISRLLKFDAIPVVVAEVCLANIGGASTLVGDPPNVILGLMLGFSFNDFVIHNGPTAVVASFAAIGVAYWLSRKRLVYSKDLDREALEAMDPAKAIRDPWLFKMGLAAFGVAIFFLVTHAWVENRLGIPLTAPLAPLIPAFFILILGGHRTETILRKIDYDVLLFFIGLFIVVGGLEKTGVIQQMADFIANLFRGRFLALISTLMWFSGVASAIVDNVPFAMSMGYVIKDMVGQVGVPALSIMVWSVSLGTDIGGNGTPIGASANVVAYASMEKHGHRIGWWRWMKLAIPPTMVALLISNLGLAVKLWLGFY